MTIVDLARQLGIEVEEAERIAPRLIALGQVEFAAGDVSSDVLRDDGRRADGRPMATRRAR